jgi:hypothetical protein
MALYSANPITRCNLRGVAKGQTYNLQRNLGPATSMAECKELCTLSPGCVTYAWDQGDLFSCMTFNAALEDPALDVVPSGGQVMWSALNCS